MADVFVYNNPGNIRYNSYLYAFIRSWYTIDGKNDMWYKVPAFRSGNTNHYVCMNANIENVSVMLLTDTGVVLKSHSNKIRSGKKSVHRDIIASIDKEALSVSQWELDNQQSFPFKTMFDGQDIKRRYRERYGQEDPKFERIANQNFRAVKRVITPSVRCGSCGKKRSR